MFVNIAYFSAASRLEILHSKQTAASVFFNSVFGSSRSTSKALNFLVCLSAFGNLISVLIGQSRVLRECGRQGVLPFTSLWTSTRPFGTPLGPYFVKWAITIIMIIAPPAGDAFNFIVDLSNYPSNLFNFLLATGLLITRYRRQKAGIPRSQFNAWNIAVAFNILANLYMLVAPWWPPTSGATGGDVSFWYATYIVTGLGVYVYIYISYIYSLNFHLTWSPSLNFRLAFCAIYYFFYVKLLPLLGKYELRQTILNLDDGATAHKLVRVPKADLQAWDAEHDVNGRLRRRDAYPTTTDDPDLDTIKAWEAR